MSEHDVTFDAMGSHVRLLIGEPGPGWPRPRRRPSRRGSSSSSSTRRCRASNPSSELCALNDDPRERVPASELLRDGGQGRAGGGASAAAAWSTRPWSGRSRPPATSPRGREFRGRRWVPRWPRRQRGTRRARARPGRWRGFEVDDEAGTITRPPGVRFDTGGTGKGLAADLIAASLRGYSRFIVDCGGDIRIGGADALVQPYEVFVEHPLTGERAHVLRLGSGGVATSGLNVRIWRGADGRYAHHLLDPATGEPAWTGLIGATALGDTAVEAETLRQGGAALRPRGRPRPCSPSAAGCWSTTAAGSRPSARFAAHPGSALPDGSRPGGGERMNAAASDHPADPRLVAGEPRLRPGRPGPGDDLGRDRADDGRQGDAPPRALAQADGDPRADRAGRHHRDRRARHHPARRPLAAPRASPASTVPFAMGFRPLFTGLGVVGGYLAALLGLSFYARKRIGARLWRKAHRATVVVYVLGLVHALGAGTDASAGLVPVVGDADRAARSAGSSSTASSRAAPSGGPKPACTRRPTTVPAFPQPAPGRSPEPQS